MFPNLILQHWGGAWGPFHPETPRLAQLTRLATSILPSFLALPWVDFFLLKLLTVREDVNPTSLILADKGTLCRPRPTRSHIIRLPCQKGIPQGQLPTQPYIWHTLVFVCMSVCMHACANVLVCMRMYVHVRMLVCMYARVHLSGCLFCSQAADVHRISLPFSPDPLLDDQKHQARLVSSHGRQWTEEEHERLALAQLMVQWIDRVPPKFICWPPNPNVIVGLLSGSRAFGGWSGHEGGALTSGISVLVRGDVTLSAVPTTWGQWSLQPEEGHHLTADLQTPSLWNCGKYMCVIHNRPSSALVWKRPAWTEKRSHGLIGGSCSPYMRDKDPGAGGLHSFLWCLHDTTWKLSNQSSHVCVYQHGLYK